MSTIIYSVVKLTSSIVNVDVIENVDTGVAMRRETISQVSNESTNCSIVVRVFSDNVASIDGVT